MPRWAVTNQSLAIHSFLELGVTVGTQDALVLASNDKTCLTRRWTVRTRPFFDWAMGPVPLQTKPELAFAVDFRMAHNTGR